MACPESARATLGAKNHGNERGYGTTRVRIVSDLVQNTPHSDGFDWTGVLPRFQTRLLLAGRPGYREESVSAIYHRSNGANGRGDVARGWNAGTAVRGGRFVRACRSQIGVPSWSGRTMKPRITVLTLGVADLARSLRFYRDGLGLASEGIVGTEWEHGAVVFFQLRAGLMLALYPRKEIAWDATLEESKPSPTEFTIGHNVRDQAEVDAVLKQAQSAGARVVKPASPTFWGGYAGYFQDPDGHLWEIAWNPHLKIED
jgi:uncharacterized protein